MTRSVSKGSNASTRRRLHLPALLAGRSRHFDVGDRALCRSDAHLRYLSGATEYRRRFWRANRACPQCHAWQNQSCSSYGPRGVRRLTQPVNGNALPQLGGGARIATRLSRGDRLDAGRGRGARSDYGPEASRVGHRGCAISPRVHSLRTWPRDVGAIFNPMRVMRYWKQR